MTDNHSLASNVLKIIDFSEQIEGAHSKVSTLIFIFIIGLISSNEEALEIGVWNGKSASVLAHIFKGLDLVDIAIPSCLNLIKQIEGCETKFYHCSSAEYLQHIDNSRKSYNFIHLDTSHTFNDTVTELRLCSKVANVNSIIVLDDWNVIYPTVQAGYFYYRFVLKGEFEVFLTAFNKGYLCHGTQFDKYASEVDKLRTFLRNYDVRTHISRTSDQDEYRAFHVRPVTPGVSEYYGGKEKSFYDILKVS